MTLEEMRQELLNSGQYRVQKKYMLKKMYNEYVEGIPLRTGVILDTETTGLNSSEEEIINIGLVQFDYDDTGKVYKMKKFYSGFQEPSTSIPKEVIELTGITDEMVAGKKFDMNLVTKIIDESEIVIAHNASFDRAFLDRLLPLSQQKVWCDSQSQVNWIGYGLKDSKLPTIARFFDFFYDEHLAMPDCLAVFEILSKEVKSKPVLLNLLETLDKDLYYVKAVKSPFNKKELLKTRNYVFNSCSRVWAKVVGKEDIDHEKDFLANQIYTNMKNESTVELVNRVDMFKNI